MTRAIAALLLLADLAAFAWLAGRIRRRPLPLSLAVGLGLLVAWQALVVSLLSPLRAVTPGPLSLAAVLPPAAAAAWAASRQGGARAVLRRAGRGLRWTFLAHGWPPALCLPLAAVLAVVAASYAPNNWDSMTYHLARVAHWIQHASVEPYATNVFRQVYYAPGAEYLLLALQAISGSDRLANGVQLLSWGLVVLAAPALARLAGTPRRVAGWAAPLVAGTPMLVLQATSTQNDLVAAVLTLALVAATLPLLHRRPRARAGDLATLGALVGAAFLVKATALVCAAPFLAAGLAGILRGLRRDRGRGAIAGGMVVGAVLIAAVAGPHAARMVVAGQQARDLTAPFVFPVLGEWEARAGNVRAALGRHLPSGSGLVSDLLGRPEALPRFHEDLAANPLQAAIAVAGIGLVAIGGRRVRPRARRAAGALLAAWVLFQVTFRSNPWITRLEVPLFALLPAALGGFAVLRPPRLAAVLAGALGAVSIAVGVNVAFLNPSRPAARVLAARTAADDYYANRPGQRRLHDAVLDAAVRTGCDRIGLYVGEDSYDYPLTWRSMQRGFAVRHVTGPDPWPCLVLSDRGLPPEGTVDRGGPWRPVVEIASGRDGKRVVAGGVWYRP